MRIRQGMKASGNRGVVGRHKERTHRSRRSEGSKSEVGGRKSERQKREAGKPTQREVGKVRGKWTG